MSEEPTVHIDESLVENRASDVAGPDFLPVPLNGVLTPSQRVTDMLVTAFGKGTSTENMTEPQALIALGVAGVRSVFVMQNADDLRSLAAAALRAADFIDGGKGKQ